MKNRRNGFTLIEILAVVIIIALIGSFGAKSLLKKTGQAKANIAQAQISRIEGAIEEFGLACSRYPADSENLQALVEAPSDLQEVWSGPYLKQKQLLDPWKNEYIYVAEGTINPGSYDIICLGSDGAEGGEGDSADIFNDQ